MVCTLIFPRMSLCTKPKMVESKSSEISSPFRVMPRLTDRCNIPNIIRRPSDASRNDWVSIPSFVKGTSAKDYLTNWRLITSSKEISAAGAYFNSLKVRRHLWESGVRMLRDGGWKRTSYKHVSHHAAPMFETTIFPFLVRNELWGVGLYYIMNPGENAHRLPQIGG